MHAADVIAPQYQRVYA